MSNPPPSPDMIIGWDPARKDGHCTIAIPPVFPGGQWMRGSPKLECPIPEAERIATMFIADPERADAIEAYARANGGKVETFLGFRFITLADPKTTLDKLATINRLEYARKRREEAKSFEEMAAARKL